MPKLSSRLRGTDAEDRLTQGGGDGLGEEDGVGDEGEAEEPPGLLFQADVDSGAESEDEEEDHYEVVDGDDEGADGEEVVVEGEQGDDEDVVEGLPPSQTQGTQNIAPTQLPDAASLPTLDEAHSTYIPTHKWPPKSVRPELARTLTSLLQRLASSPGNLVDHGVDIFPLHPPRWPRT